MVSSTYDYIVIGAGAGGAVMANRLSENPDVRVLLLEAGTGDIPEAVRIPAAWPTLWGTSINWGYQTVPQEALGGRVINEPRGKVVGGSSDFYIMMHIRGHRSDYDNWAYNGAPGWAYDDIMKYFQKLENQEDETSPWAGHGGPISVINAKNHHPNPTSEVFLEACYERGYPRTEDFNGPNMIGAGWHHVNIKDGKRHGANEAYIEPILGKRPNFILSPNSYATRLLFEGTRCTGVEYRQGNEKVEAYADREVIVCAGAIESPHLLMLSGIGEAEHLEEFGIDVLVDLPGVGENFHNHVLTGLIYETKREVPPPRLNIAGEAAMFVKSSHGWLAPDLQIAFVHAPFDIIIGQQNPNAVSMLPGLVRPLSRGYIALQSADPFVKPLIDPNYLSMESDVERLVKTIEIGRDIFSANAFKDWLTGKELLPGPQYRTPEQLEEFVMQRADSYHHQAGSCKMGLDDMAVVDPECRVWGIDGLRVADASVMPAVPSGNCHAGILMIAERVADLVKQENGTY